MIAGTVLAAAGLNYGVLALGQPEVSGDIQPEVAASPQPMALSAEPEIVTLAASAPAVGAPEDAPAVTSEAPSSPVPPLVTSDSGPGGAAVADPADAPPTPAATPTPSDQTPAPGAQPAPVAPSPGPRPANPAAPAQTPTVEVPTTAKVPTTAAPTTPAPTTAAPTTEPPTTIAPTQPSPGVNTEYLTYQFSGVASIVIAVHDGETLKFWSATKEPGWVHRVDDDGPGKVKVKFLRLADEEEAEFEVSFEDGELKVKQEL